MSQSILSNVIASGFPSKQSLFIYNPVRQGFDALNIGYLTSGQDFISGSKIVSFGIVTSGVKLFDDQICKAATFFNHDQPAYRVYRADSTGTYLDYVKVDSGNASTKVEFKGITNLSNLAYQKHGNSDTSTTGRVLLYL